MKFILVLCSCFLVLTLFGCTPSTTTPSTTTPSTVNSLESEKYGHYGIWTDPETGVQYIVYRDKSGYAGHGGITPRLNSDGTLYVVSAK